MYLMFYLGAWKSGFCTQNRHRSAHITQQRSISFAVVLREDVKVCTAQHKGFPNAGNVIGGLKRYVSNDEAFSAGRLPKVP